MANPECDRVRWLSGRWTVMAMAGVLAAVILLGVTALPAAPLSTASARPAAAAAHSTHKPPGPLSATTEAARAPRHGPKQGTVAVVFSVIGFIVLVVLVVALGSLSARRRVRDRPAPKVNGTDDSGQPGGDAGTPPPTGGTSG